ncbi:MAG: imidazole glycerol phosphate synthase subunit HisF [Merdibacter sp.]
MHTKRIIPCLDVKEGKVVKGVNFVGLKEVGDPVELARQYYEQGADEIVFLDISATHEGRKTMADVAREVAKVIFIPFTIGGGIRTIDDIRTLLRGADKVSLNSAAVRDPQLVKAGAEIFGSQCIVAAIDAKRRADDSGWNVVINGGRIDTGIDLLEWVAEVTRLGAGEILLTSMDADGTKQGFDLPMLQAVNKIIDVPLIASGGCGNIQHIEDVLKEDAHAADAALAASIFHYGEHTVGEVKDYLSAHGIPVRMKVRS